MRGSRNTRFATTGCTWRIDVRQELLGLGSANLLVAFGHGYPVAGGLYQSAVNEKTGGKTPLSLIFASVTLALCLLFFTEFLRNLPKAAFAAIVLMVVTGLIKVQELRHLWRISKLAFAVAAVALVDVLLFASVTCFALKELRIGSVALTGLRQWLMPSSTSRRAPLEI